MQPQKSRCQTRLWTDKLLINRFKRYVEGVVTRKPMTSTELQRLDDLITIWIEKQ